MENKFQNIYDNNEWGNGSGAGSRIKSVKKYMSFLEGFIQMNNVTSVVDAGCGDWQFSKNINWGQVSYKGFDIVNTVVENNKWISKNSTMSMPVHITMISHAQSI